MDMTLSQRIMLVTTFVVRTGGDPESFVPALRAAVRDVDPTQAMSGVRTVDDYAAAQLQDLRQYAAILTTFSVAAVILAMVGVFGVVAYSVSQRRNEIGIRMAVGAGSRDVLGLVLKQGMLMIAAGILIGALSAFALTRTLQNLLWGVTPTDPATFALAAFSLAIVGLLACYFPARRALKVDPIIALRDE
jgi:putative ABC transport system permease protein